MSKSPSLRRIQADIRELALDPSDRYHAAPLEHDMFEWHFTIRGADDTDFAGGIYHGRILLPSEYPFKPPHILFLTKSGRFETHTKVCLSFSAFHPELWQPAWGIRLILEALISFLPTPADGAVGSLDWSPAERRKLAKASVNFVCPTCACRVQTLLPPLKEKQPQSKNDNNSSNSRRNAEQNRFQREIAQLQQLQLQQHPKDNKKVENVKNNAEEGGSAQEGETRNSDDAMIEEICVPVEKRSAAQPATGALNLSPPAKQGNVPPGVAHVTAPVATTTTTTTEKPLEKPHEEKTPPVATNNTNVTPSDPSSMVQSVLDPILQAMIVLASILCCVLGLKVRSLLAELNSLQDVSG